MTKRSLNRLLPALALAVVSLTGGACARQHLSSHYGEAYVAWFSAQHLPARPESAVARHSIETLDAQEAELVSKNYRRNVSGGSGEGQGRQIMMVAPRGGAEGYMPPPSVPAGQ